MKDYYPKGKLNEGRKKMAMMPKNSKLTSGKILIVHPKQEVAAILKNSLEKQGFEIEICLEAIKARDLTSTKDYDFIFSSYQLDSMNGLQFISSMRDDVNSYFILLFDMKIDSLPEKTQEVIQKIAHGYLERPFDDQQFGTLMAKIKSLDSVSA